MSLEPQTLEADYDALRNAAGAVVVPRDVVAVHGPDAVSFLQGQLSQDIDALDVGQSGWTFLLQPTGKVDALLRCWRTGEDEVVLDVDGGYGAAVVARLERFKLRVKADVETRDWRCVAVRGPRAHEWAEGALVADWPGLPGADLLGPDVGVPSGVRACSPEAYEVVRVEAGWPAMGAELDERTIPAEAGVVEQAVSFTKGCFTGQELVARIDSRGGNVPRRLRGVLLEGDALPPAGATLHVGDKQVGALTSVVRSPARGVVALAYVQRAVEPPAEVTVRWPGGEAPARAVTLPMG